MKSWLYHVDKNDRAEVSAQAGANVGRGIDRHTMNAQLLKLPTQRLFTARQQPHKDGSIHFESVPIFASRFREIVNHQAIDNASQEVECVLCHAVDEQHTRDEGQMGRSGD